MIINRLRVQNYKSFSSLDISFEPLNIIIGPNASGKSNLVSIFQFIRNIADHGLDNAIAMEGGVGFIRNTFIGADKNLLLSIDYDPRIRFVGKTEDGLELGVEINSTHYEFELKFFKKRKGFSIVNDCFTHNYRFVHLEEIDNELKEKEVLGEGFVEYKVERGLVQRRFHIPEEIQIDPEDILPPALPKSIKFPTRTLFLESPFLSLANYFNEVTENIAIYNFDPRLPQKAVLITGKNDLAEDGSNLSVVLKRIIRKKDDRRKLVNLLTDVLPFVNNVSVQKFIDRFLFTIFEDFHGESTQIPASFLSEGTIGIVAIITALYFEQKNLSIFEEPERNIHPQLVAKLLRMFNEVTPKKQIIITTHNPEIVKYADLPSLLFVHRDKKGFSSIFRPAEISEVQAFLSNEVGIDELYTQNILEALSND